MRLFILFIVDTLLFFLALFLALFIRSGAVDMDEFFLHLPPFALLFVFTLLIMYILGMYDKHYIVLKRNIFNALLVINSFLFMAIVILFYFVPVFEITPKTNMFIFLVVFSLFFFLWRTFGVRVIQAKSIQAVLIGEDSVLEKILSPERISHLTIVRKYSITDDLKKMLFECNLHNITHILFDFRNAELKHIVRRYDELILNGFVCIDTGAIKEELSGYVENAQLDEVWFLEGAQKRYRTVFMSIKRIIDMGISVCLFPLLIVLTPFVALAIKIQDGGRVFVKQKRYGLYRKVFILYKFRTMSCDDEGVWHTDMQKVVTPLGSFLRKSRIDELPQIINVFCGELALIGPRPDMVALGDMLCEKIPYYNMRYIVRPGITGWAQVRQGVVPQSISETKDRLGYDLFYIQHMSLFLEFKIVLKTIRLLLSKIFTL